MTSAGAAAHPLRLRFVPMKHNVINDKLGKSSIATEPGEAIPGMGALRVRAYVVSLPSSIGRIRTWQWRPGRGGDLASRMGIRIDAECTAELEGAAF
jgi:hypothetical protein